MVAVASILRGRLDDFYLDSFVELVEHREAVIAFENLCVNLDEHEIRMTRAEHDLIVDYSTRLKLDPSWFECLAELVDVRAKDS